MSIYRFSAIYSRAIAAATPPRRPRPAPAARFAAPVTTGGAAVVGSAVGAGLGEVVVTVVTGGGGGGGAGTTVSVKEAEGEGGTTVSEGGGGTTVPEGPGTTVPEAVTEGAAGSKHSQTRYIDAQVSEQKVLPLNIHITLCRGFFFFCGGEERIRLSMPSMTRGYSDSSHVVATQPSMAAIKPARFSHMHR